MRKILLIIIGILSFLVGQSQENTITFNHTGNDQYFTVPCGVTSITVKAWGAGGNASSSQAGGGGAYAEKTITVMPGNSYTIRVGAPSGSANTRDSYFYLTPETHLVKAAGADGGNGGATGTSIGDIKWAGGNGGTRNGSSTGGGGGSSASPTQQGNSGKNGNEGGTGGITTDPLAGNGGDGGTASWLILFYLGGNGENGQIPGGGGGQNDSRNGNPGKGANGSVIITYIGVSEYCDVNFGPRTRPITLIDFGDITINNSNSTSQSSYLGKCEVAHVTAGESYDITLKGNSDGNNRDYYTVFIDWDNSGEFNTTNGFNNETGEKFDIGDLRNSTGVDNKSLTRSITIPADVEPGVKGVRIVKRNGGYVGSACNENDYTTYGQVIDFQIEISGCSQPTSATVDKSTVCADSNNPTSINLRQEGGQLSPGQTWKWYKGATPSGIAINSNTNGDANFDTQVTETTTFYVRAEGGDCGTDGEGKTVTVTVNQPGNISLTSPAGTDQQTICSHSGNIDPIVYTISGGAIVASITAGQLPAGLTGTYNAGNKTFTISGTPTESGTFDYTISLSGNAPCTNPDISGEIIVLPELTGVSYTPLSSYCSGGGIQPLLPQLDSGQDADDYTFSSGTYPPGLSINKTTGEISGTPTTAGTYHFKVTASNGYCSVQSDEITMVIGASGAVSQSLTPTGTFDLCSTDDGIVIGLTSSEQNVDYALYLGGMQVSDIESGTGSNITFTPIGGGTKFKSQGVYTAQTADACGVQMNGSVTINVTPVPNATFEYENDQTTFCQSQLLSGDANLSGATSNGYFSASPAGLEFLDADFGNIDLTNSQPGTYTVSYNVLAAGGCSSYQVSKTITISTSAEAFNLTGGGDYCVGSSIPDVILDGSTSGMSYDLYQQEGFALVETRTGDGGPITFSGLAPGTYLMTANLSGSCLTPMNGSVTITENPIPDPVYIIGGDDEVCIGTPVPLMASSNSIAGQEQTATFSYTNINENITDNNKNGHYERFSVENIPLGATITEVSVYFKTGGNTAVSRDLRINLKGPNGKVLNLANQIGNAASRSLTWGGYVYSYQNLYRSGTTFSSASNNSIQTGTDPRNGVYAPLAQITPSVVGDNSVPGEENQNTSNVTTFASLYDNNDPNDNWYLSFRDADKPSWGSTVSTLIEATLTIKYIVPVAPVSVTWKYSPDINDLYTDPGGEFDPYKFVNDARTTVYANASTADPKYYTATLENEYGCSSSDTKKVTFKDGPVLSINPDYCSEINPNSFVVIRAESDENVSGTWQWSSDPDNNITNKSYSSELRTKTAGDFYVSATYNGCVSTKRLDIANELVTNGNFEGGNDGSFFTGYNYTTQHYINNNTNSGLWPEGRYTVDSNPQDYHSNFWGKDHTSNDGTGKFMIVNGYPGSNVVIWRQTVSVQPNTTYYFSAYAMSLNDQGPFANLQFAIEGNGGPGEDVYIDNFNAPLNPGVSNNSNNGWQRFYGRWTSGPNTTVADIEIINLETATGGNDFGLDDISFGSLDPFFNLKSEETTADQAFCEEATIATIQYEYGGNGSAPALTWYDENDQPTSGPTGVEPYYNGRDYLLRGIGSEDGVYKYKLTLEVCEDEHHNKTYLDKFGQLEIVAKPDPGDFKTASNDVISVCFEDTPTIELENTKGKIADWFISNDGTSWTSLSNADKDDYTFGNEINKPVYLRATAEQKTLSGNSVAGCPNKSKDVMVALKNVWGGRDNFTTPKTVSSNSWNTASNWSFNTVPGNNTCEYVVISDLGLNGPYPILNTGEEQVPNLILWDNSTVTINEGASLKVKNDIMQRGDNGGGHIIAPSGKVEFNGQVPQTISSNVFKDTTLAQLVVNNSSSAGLQFTKGNQGSLGITKDITFGESSTAKLESVDGAITLKSTRDYTANLGALGQNNQVSGEFVVERFINTDTTNNQVANGPHGKKWIFLATPTEGQTIKDSWMEGGGPLPGPNNGYGVMLSGPVGAWDRYSPNPSIKEFNGNSFNYDGASGSGSTLYNPKGWMTFVRGDRSVYEVFDGVDIEPANNTTLRSKGTLKTGNFNFTYTPTTSGFVSFGNPYPAVVDLREVLKNSDMANAVVYFWNTGLSQGPFGLDLGGYEAFTLVGNDLVNSNSPYNINNYLYSGQAILINTMSKPGPIKFSEGDKNIAAAQHVQNFRPGADLQYPAVPVMTVNLYTNDKREDGVQQIFNKNFSDGIEFGDGTKVLNEGINLSIRHNKDVILAVERRSPLTKTDTVHYELTGITPGDYSFKFNTRYLSMSGMRATLIDNFTKAETPVDLDGETDISFKVTDDKASTATNRFMLVFDGNRKLDLAFKDIDAVKDGGAVNVTWNVKDENNVDHYVVMASNDGEHYSDIATVNADGQGAYSSLDKTPESGYNYYIVRAISVDGAVLMSPEANIFLGYGQPSISVFPNPVKGGAINLVLKNQPQGKYSVRLLSSKGQTIDRISIAHAGGNLTKRIPWKNELAHGSYRLEVLKPDGKVEVIQVVY